MLRLQPVRDSASAPLNEAATKPPTAADPEQPSAPPPALVASPSARLREMFPPAPSKHTPSPDQAAATVTHLFRKALAADAYHRMFSQGTCFANLGYTPGPGPKHPESLDMLKTLSRRNVEALENQVNGLSRRESHFLKALANSPWHFRHQTFSTVIAPNPSSPENPNSGDKITIYSNLQLNEKKISAIENTLNEDKVALANHDFVFFGVEFTDDSKKNKINSDTFYGVPFGDKAYLMSDQDSRAQLGYLTLTDHLLPTREGWQLNQELTKWPEKDKPMLDPIIAEIDKIDTTDPATGKSMMFSFNDMKKGLGLSMIDFLRKSDAVDFKNWLYRNAEDNDIVIHRAINLIFQPEFHLPKLWSSTTFNHAP